MLVVFNVQGICRAEHHRLDHFCFFVVGFQLEKSVFAALCRMAKKPVSVGNAAAYQLQSSHNILHLSHFSSLTLSLSLSFTVCLRARKTRKDTKYRMID